MKTYKFKVYASHKNRHLVAQMGIASEVWNTCIALHKRYYRMTGKHLQVNRLKVQLTKMKKRRRFQHWTALGSQAIQDVAERIENAYQRFFDNLKTRNAGETIQRVNPPTFKRRRHYTSFTLKQAGWAVVSNGFIRIGTQLYRFWQSREIAGTIKTVTIKQNRLGNFYLCFSCTVAVSPSAANPVMGSGWTLG